MWGFMQASVGVPGRKNLPGDLLAGLPPGVRLPDRHSGAGVPPGVRARVRAHPALPLRRCQHRPHHPDHHHRPEQALQGERL